MNTNQYPNNASDDENRSLFGLNFDPASLSALRSAASWAKILGVTGVIVGSLLCLWMIIGLILAETVRSNGSSSPFTDMFVEEGSTMGAVMMIIAGGVFIFSGLLAIKFASSMRAALLSNDQHSLNKGFLALKSYFTLRGVTMIIVLVLFALTFLASLSDNS